MKEKRVVKKIVSMEEGYNLIEVMIAIVILAVGILGVAMMQITAIDANTRANVTTLAINDATATLERLINEDDANLASGTDPDNPDISWTVEPGPSANSRNITVTVQYFYKGRPTEVELNYIRTDGQYVP